MQGDINFWDYICLAASLAFSLTYLIWILVTKPFTPYTRRKTWRRLLGDAVVRNLLGMDAKLLRYVMGTTPWVYAAWAKWYNLQTTVTELDNDARLLWIGPKRMEKVILYLHGGGYAFPVQSFSATFWHYVQQQLESRSVKVGIGILNYTLVPTEPFPMQLRQAVSAVEYLLSNGVQPENIQIVGDSAGGNLVLALLSHILHPLEGIPTITLKKPFAGMYMMSPWVRLSTSSTLNNDDLDVITKPVLKTSGNVVLSGLPESLTSYIEPSLAPEGWFTGAHTYVEKFLITAGDKECMCDDITEFAHRFQQENKEVQFVTQPDGVHDDPYLDFFVSQPQLGVLTPVIVDWIHEGFNCQMYGSLALDVRKAIDGAVTAWNVSNSAYFTWVQRTAEIYSEPPSPCTMYPFNAILEYLCTGCSSHYDLLEEQPALGFPREKKQHPQTTQSLAADIISTLYAADTNDEHLARRLQDVVRETGWYEGLAAAVLQRLENALKEGAPMAQAMKDVHDKAAQVVADIWGFAKEHPVFCAFVALGILVILAPWAIEVLGFGELGPIEGTFAAWWQSTYAGSVPAGSLFSFFQRLGMIWTSATPSQVHAKSHGGMGAIRL